MGFPKQEYWSGLPFTSLVDLPDPGMESVSLHWQVCSLPLVPVGKLYLKCQFSRSVVSDSFDPMDCSTPGLPVHHRLPELLKLTSIESVMPSNHLILCHPLLPSFFLSIRVFSNESVLCIRWPKYWSFSLSIIPSKEIPGLISFRMDWLDLLAVQGTLKSLLQHYSSKVSVLWCSAFFIVQLSHPYMTTGKTIALTRSTFGGKEEKPGGLHSMGSQRVGHD